MKIRSKSLSIVISILLLASMILGMIPAFALTGIVNVEEDPAGEEVTVTSWDELVGKFSTDGSTIVIPDGTTVIINDEIVVPSSGEYTITGGTIKWGKNHIAGIVVNNTILSLENITLDGTECMNYGLESSHGISISAGTANLNNTVIENFGINQDNLNRADISVISLSNNATVNINAGSIIRNNSTARSSISSSNSIINIDGGIITGNSCDSGSIINCHNNSTLNITSGTISGNTKYDEESHALGTIWISDNSHININGGTITQNSCSSAISVENNSTLNMTGGTISENQGTNGGGIHVGLGSTATITGGTIEGNSAQYGAGIYVSGSKLILGNETGGPTITRNKTYQTSSNSGGGVYLNGNSILNCINTTISYNEAAEGGGITIWSKDVTGYIKNSNIEYNSANEGGGIHNTFGANIEISDTTISNNTASGYGGGIWGNNFTLKNTSITNNSARVGGGVASADGISGYNIKDSEIANNTAAIKAGGVYAEKDITISGKVVVNNNSSERNSKDNMFISFYDEADNTGITIEDNLTNDSRIGVSFNDPQVGTLVAKPAATYTLTDSDLSRFFEDTDQFNVVDGEDSVVRTFVLGAGTPKYKITGLVTDNKIYEAIPNVKMQLLDNNGNELENVTTSETGRFEFTGLIDGEYKVVATYNGITKEVSVTINGADEEADIVLDLSNTNTNHKITGTVTNSNNDEPLAGAKVEIKDQEGNKIGETTTKEDGTYEIPNLPDGSYTITVSYPDPTNPDSNITKDVSVTINGADEQVNIELDIPDKIKENHKVFGTITDSNTNQPIPGVKVLVKDSEGNEVGSTVTKEDGTYEIPNLPDGSYTLEVVYEDPSGNPDKNIIKEVPVTINGADEQVDIELNIPNKPAETYKILGTAKYEVELLSNVYVQLIDKNTGRTIKTTYTNNDGKYEFDDLTPGVYEVKGTYTKTTGTGTAAGGSVEQLDAIVAVTIVDKDMTADLQFKTEPVNPPITKTYSISGKVTDSNGTTLNGITVQLIDSTGKVIATTSTNDKGNYQFDGLKPGNYKVEVTYNGLNESGSGVIVDKDITVNIEVKVEVM